MENLFKFTMYRKYIKVAHCGFCGDHGTVVSAEDHMCLYVLTPGVLTLILVRCQVTGGTKLVNYMTASL